MSGPAPFPFLRRGDGMKKYSKVQYPTYKRANNRATTDHVDLDRVTSLSSAVDSPAQENNTGNSLSFAVSSPSTSCLQAMENIEVKQFELLEKLAQELSLSDSSAYVRLLNGVCMPGGLETTSENAAGQLPNEFHDVPSSSASPLRTVNQPLDDRASLNQLNSNTMSERSLEGLKSSSNMQTAFKFAWDQQNGKAAKSLPKQPLEPTAVQPSISTADDSIAMQKRLECMVEQLEMDAQEVENVQTILAKTFERVRADGSVESVYANGTVQEVSADGQIVTYHYSNGDSRRFLPDGSEVYLFRCKDLVQIREPSGLLKLKYSDGRMETHHLDGRIEIEFPKNSSSMTVFPDGRQSRRFADGTVAERDLDGTETFSFKDGSKEIRHKDYVRRDFPNGDVKFKHADGTEETRYANGRLRVKDPNGKVIRDEVIARR